MIALNWVRRLAVALLFSPVAFAQNAGGVFGPEVTPNSKAAEVRFIFAPASDGRPDRFTSRFHYQQTISDSIRLRGVIQGADTSTSDFDYDLVQFEAQWQFAEDEDRGWDSALRLDLQIADDRPDLIALNWTSDVLLSERFFVRGIAQGGFQIGDNRQDGLFLQSRFGLNYRTDPGYTFQIQVFNFWGTTSDFQDLNDQNHSIGPAVSGPIGEKWSFEASSLFGLTDATADVDLRLFLTRKF
ncbi:MAG: hypothetical protein AAF498_03405 [Pseudomonadota bacterium]